MESKNPILKFAKPFKMNKKVKNSDFGRDFNHERKTLLLSHEVLVKIEITKSLRQKSIINGELREKKLFARHLLDVRLAKFTYFKTIRQRGKGK